MRSSQLDDVFRVYPSPEGGVAALQGLSLAVEQGELCVVLGPSGSGKSTLLRIVAGFDRASAGSVRVAGVDVGALGGWARRAVPLALDRLRRPALLARARGRADRAGARRDPARAGRRRRARSATHARTSCSNASASAPAATRIRASSPAASSSGSRCAPRSRSAPALLIADEPTGELDAATASDVLALIAELVRESGGTALVVSHDPASAERADRVIHVRDGRISDERVAGAAGDGAIVVGRGGWLRLPEDVLRSAGIDRHATAELRGARRSSSSRREQVFLKHKLLAPA